jgi:hypothetical protein
MENDQQNRYTEYTTNDIHIMKNIKIMMDKDICLQSINEDYKQIYSMVNDYLQKNCKHNIIKDYIDISPEKS